MAEEKARAGSAKADGAKAGNAKAGNAKAGNAKAGNATGGNATGGNATRRLKWLAGVIVAVIALYAGAWAYLASRLDNAAATAIARAEAGGTAIACEGRDVRGFPFRLGLHCDATGAVLADGTEAEAGAFRSAAQIYAPGLVVSELDGPLALDGPAGLVQASWDVARASTRLGTQRLNDGRLAVTNIDAVLDAKPDPNGGPLRARIGTLNAFVRPNGEDVDVALRVDALDPAPVNGRDAPPVDLNVDATVTDAAGALAYGAPAPQSLRGRAVRLRAADVTIAGGGRLGASGEVSVDADGLPSGTLDVAFSDLAATADALAALAPEYEGAIRSVAGLLGGGGGGGGLLAGFLGGGSSDAPEPKGTDRADEADRAGGTDRAGETRVTITLDRGQARLGIIPLGSVPPLP